VNTLFISTLRGGIIAKKRRTYEDLSQEEKQKLIERYPYKTDAEIFKDGIVSTKSELADFIDEVYEDKGVLLEKSSVDVPDKVNKSGSEHSALDIMVSGLDDDMAEMALNMREKSLDPITIMDDIITLQRLRAMKWMAFEFDMGAPSEDLQDIYQHISQMASQKHKMEQGILLKGEIEHTLVGLIDEIDDDDDYDYDKEVPIIEPEDLIEADYELKEGSP